MKTDNVESFVPLKSPDGQIRYTKADIVPDDVSAELMEQLAKRYNIPIDYIVQARNDLTRITAREASRFSDELNRLADGMARVRDAFSSISESIAAAFRVGLVLCDGWGAIQEHAERKYRERFGSLPGSSSTKRLRKKRRKIVSSWWSTQKQSEVER